ncbi:MAG: hypothetical protein LBI92_09570 [Azoarcus sp.]|jgi:antitoxin component YwqK of YwqJK toxin-antitoxin module|nr:hypothetical protein [Azoarcus sp.]
MPNMVRHQRITMLVLLVTLFLGGYFYFCKDSIFSEKQVNAFSPGQIIRGELGEEYRRFIQISPDGYYVIQDFRVDGRPMSSPYRVKDRDDLMKNYSKQTSIDGLYVADERDIYGGIKYLNYLNGIKEGTSFALHTNGNIKRLENYSRGNLKNFVHFFRNGNKQIEGVFSDKSKENKIVGWWYTGGIRYEGSGDNKDGIIWYENGKKMAEFHEKDGINNGTTWHEGGQVSSEITIDRSRSSFKCSEYSETGEIIIKNETSFAICTDIESRYYKYSLRKVFETDDRDVPP